MKLFVAQGFDRIKACSLACRIDTEEEADTDREGKGNKNRSQGDNGRYFGEFFEYFDEGDAQGDSQDPADEADNNGFD